MSKFKVGDRVRHKLYRTKYEVFDVRDDGFIQFDGMAAWYSPEDYELVEPSLPADWAIERAIEITGWVYSVHAIKSKTRDLDHQLRIARKVVMQLARYIETKEQPPELPEVAAAREYRNSFEGPFYAPSVDDAFVAGVKWAKENLK